ncbi:hypothetical protein HS088_TW08G00990 [Tripterygium wilfordii]|uniref:Uncharacterized protein n=1 Tax=Tripterygium wilfordii TaxID=458696 RepID=A0A7J7DDC9_TRIWF|nr:uncharacterized protein LOC120004461 [Tripterygium wilfordii]KAF5744385.1 hypothetical protein HS088_TW08G00990 [Tripterygium wilfordii]
MRIRKNAKLSTILQFSAAPEWRLQTHVCQLNQSPWDVINFSDETYPAPSLNQLGGNDSFALDTSLRDSAGVVESVESMMDCEDYEAMEMKTNEDNGGEENKLEGTKNKKKKFCKGLNNKTSCVSTKRGAAMAERRTRPGRAKKGSSCNSSNPYEFYYYSGFGPSWGKRRADRINGGGGETKIKSKFSKSRDVEADIIQNTTAPPLSLVDRIEEVDFVEEEDDYEEDDDDEQQRCSSNGGKKRVRKLVKARSLKSLM